MPPQSLTVRNAVSVTLLGGVAAIALAGCWSRGSSGGNEAVQTASSPCTPAPFVNNNGTVPPGYNKPLFQLSHDYPTVAPPPLANPPWRAAINNGVITTGNANAYVLALKNYVSAQMRKMLLDPEHWNAAAEGWYNEPWTGCLREPVHGMYLGTDAFPIDQFPNTGLTKPFSTYVLTFYDRRAANALYNVWGATAQNPTLNGTSAQFAPGSIAVKAAFATADASTWPWMKNALQWPAYISINATKGRGAGSTPQLDRLSFMQFDIIVKDPASSPKTGWVYTTLVYDPHATGDVWDRMVPLGVMWGNDPEVNNSQPNQPPLRETWINPNAPAYSTATLGWGGRLSGPNDGAVNDALVDGKEIHNLRSSSCLGCHISAQYQMKSDLLPTPGPNPQFPNNDGYMLMLAPGSQQWMRWFQDPPGTQTMDPGTVPLDYDMIFAFKSLRIWHKATHPNSPMAVTDRRGHPLEGYNGKPTSN